MNIFPLMRGFWRSFKKACERKKGVFGVDLSGVVPLNPRCLVDRRCRGALGSISRELLSTQQENGCRSSDLWPKPSWQMFYWAWFVCVCVCACVRVSLIDTTVTNWDTIHIVYFQLPWKSREIWPCSPGKQFTFFCLADFVVCTVTFVSGMLLLEQLGDKICNLTILTFWLASQRGGDVKLYY